MRSKLFVPGSRGELYAKALATDADAISFDVEDSVPEDYKFRAREQLVEFLRSSVARESAKMLIVRINAVGSPHFEADLQAFTIAPVAMLNVPKIESAADVHEVVGKLEQVERRNRVQQPSALLVNIETARAFQRAAEIAGAHPRVLGLQLGLADLFESLHMDRDDAASVQATLFTVRMAAGAAGRFAYDSAFPDLADTEGFRREARQARRLGFLGKSCVHPKQVALANEIFSVDELDLLAARRIVAAAKDAARVGHWAFVVDGRMIDLPFLKRAQALLAEASDSGRSP